MSSPANLEMLEKSHDFPCPYIFKIVGKADEGFVARIVVAMREELLIDIDPPYSVREAVGGRHLSITFEPVVQSAQQVVTIYARLARLQGVLMLL